MAGMSGRLGGTSGAGTVTSGDPAGTSGERRIFWRGAACLVAAVTMFNTIDVFTVLHDVPGLAPVKPIVWNLTSALAFGPAAWVIWRAFRLAPPASRPLWRTLAVHAAGAVVMAAVHVTLFTLMRKAIFAALGLPYGFGPISDFPYEFRKDLLAYGLGVAIYWVLTKVAPAPASTPATSGPPSFDIREGARVIRARLTEILAVTSAGNYVEFVLEDGRRPLMRASLASIAAELEPRGFVRTHRSWLVNAARVRELRPEKSGDYAVGLGPIEAPLSRRFPDALTRLRREGR
jgi:CubicO group peptidase (beta-lactamase class C family)